MSVQLGLPLEPARSYQPASGASVPTSVGAIGLTNAGAIVPTNTGAIAPTSVTESSVYFVRNRFARQYRLRVDPDGRVRVTIPRGGSRREAETFVHRCRDWIAGQRARLTSSAHSDERDRWQELARRLLPQRLRELARDHGLEVAKVSIRDQRTRWGSCGRDGHICLNWRLLLMPDWVRDYVLIHELMHLRRLDHSPEYWRLVAAACPGFRQARQWLRFNGPSLR